MGANGGGENGGEQMKITIYFTRLYFICPFLLLLEGVAREIRERQILVLRLIYLLESSLGSRQFWWAQWPCQCCSQWFQIFWYIWPHQKIWKWCTQASIYCGCWVCMLGICDGRWKTGKFLAITIISLRCQYRVGLTGLMDIARDFLLRFPQWIVRGSGGKATDVLDRSYVSYCAEWHWFADVELPQGVGSMIDCPYFYGAPGTRSLVGHWKTPSILLDWAPECDRSTCGVWVLWDRIPLVQKLIWWCRGYDDLHYRSIVMDCLDPVH